MNKSLTLLSCLLLSACNSDNGHSIAEGMYKSRWTTDQSLCSTKYIIFSSKEIRFFKNGKAESAFLVKRVVEDPAEGGVMFVIRVTQTLAAGSVAPTDLSDVGLAFLPKGDLITLIGEGDPNHLMPVTPKDKNYAKFDLQRCK